MLVSPLAGALSDRIGRRPIMITGLTLLTVSFAWVAWRGTLGASWVELVIALFIGGVGMSMALPTRRLRDARLRHGRVQAGPLGLRGLGLPRHALRHAVSPRPKQAQGATEAESAQAQDPAARQPGVRS